jgi:hypothetical protein
MNLDFGLFLQDGKGPLWRESFADLDEARRKAEEVARTEGLECFVYNLKTYTEVVRFSPRSQKRTESEQEWSLPTRPATKT